MEREMVKTSPVDEKSKNERMRNNGEEGVEGKPADKKDEGRKSEEMPDIIQITMDEKRDEGSKDDREKNEDEINMEENSKDNTKSDKENNFNIIKDKIDGMYEVKKAGMKRNGYLYYKKQNPSIFSWNWKNYFVILEESKQQLLIFKSLELFEKDASSKFTVDLEFVEAVTACPQKKFQKNLFPFKITRRAGLSSFKLAAPSAEERAKWITALEAFVTYIQSDKNQKPNDIPADINLSSTKAVKYGESTKSSTVEGDLVVPRKLSQTGPKVETSEFKRVTLKKVDSMKEKKDPEVKTDDNEGDPQKMFGVSLKRVSTDRPKREPQKSIEAEEWQERALSLRSRKQANLPLSDTIPVSTKVDTLTKITTEGSPKLESRTLLKKADDIQRKRSPSPNIPVSKSVQYVVEKNNIKELTSHVTLARKKSNIRHAVTVELQDFEKEETQLKDLDDNVVDEAECTVIKNQNDSNGRNVNKDISSNIDFKDITENQNNNIIDESTTNNTCISDQINAESQAHLQTISNITTDNTEKDKEVSSINIKLQPIVNCITSENVAGSESSSIKVNNSNEIDKRVIPSDESLLHVINQSNRNSSSSNDGSQENKTQYYRRSYVSLLSSESDEPLPRMCFLGAESDRSSCESYQLKEYTKTVERDSDEKYPTMNSDIDSQVVAREKVKRSGRRPESCNSIGGRNSLILPEYTVMEENPSELSPSVEEEFKFDKNDEVDNKSSIGLSETNSSHVIISQEQLECTLDKFIDGMTSNILNEVHNIIANKCKNIEGSIKLNENYKVEETKMNNFNKNNSSKIKTVNGQSQNPKADNTNNMVSHKTGLPKFIEENMIHPAIIEEQRMQVPTEDNSYIDTNSGSNSNNPVSESNLPDLIITTNNDQTNKDQTDINLIDKQKLFSNHINESNENKDIHKNNKEVMENVTKDELKNNDEENDSFPIFGDVTLREKEEHLMAFTDTRSVRASGMTALKELLKEENDSVEYKAGINRLGHSVAVEKLKKEIQ